MIWKLPTHESNEIVFKKCRALGADEINIKVADGIYTVQNALPFIEAARAAGFKVRGWHYVYGIHPELEAAAIRPALSLGITGIDVNAEAHYKRYALPGAESKYMAKCREYAKPEQTFTLCSYRYPSLHREIRWQVWDELLDGWSPQVYWIGSQNGAENMKGMHDEYRAFTEKPITPVLPTFFEHNWKPTGNSLRDAAMTARELGMKSLQVYRYGHIWEYGLDEAVTDIFGSSERPPASDVGIVPVGTLSYLTPKSDGLRVRAEPSTSSAILATLKASERIPCLDFQTGERGSLWARTMLGWVAVYYPNWAGAMSQLAVIE